MQKWIGESIFFSIGIIIFGVYIFDPKSLQYSFLFPDKSFWTPLAAIGTVGAALMAWKANLVVQKQLAIEQKPYVVLVDEIFVHEVVNKKDLPIDDLDIKVKNVGRGPALRVTITGLKTDRNNAFFEADQPHSIDLFSGEKKIDWKVDSHNLKMIIKDQTGKEISTFSKFNQPIFLYIHYFNQDEKEFITKVRLEPFHYSPGNLSAGTRKFSLKVMENEMLV